MRIVAINLVAELKKHPYGAAVVAVFGVILILMLRKGSSGTAASSGATYNSQELQLQAALAAQQSQAGAQTQAAQIAANAQTQQVNAAASVQNTQTEAQLIAALAQNQTNAQGQQLSADVLNNQLHSETIVAQSQTEAALDALLNTNDTQLKAYTQQIQYQTAVQQSNVALAAQLAPTLQHLGIGENYNNEILGLFGAATGSPGVAVSGINASSNVLQTNSTASASKFNSLVNGLSSSLNSILASL